MTVISVNYLLETILAAGFDCTITLELKIGQPDGFRVWIQSLDLESTPERNSASVSAETLIEVLLKAVNCIRYMDKQPPLRLPGDESETGIPATVPDASLVETPKMTGCPTCHLDKDACRCPPWKRDSRYC